MTEIKSPNPEIRRRAVFDTRDRILASSPADAGLLISVLSGALKDPDGMVRRAAAVSLFDIGPRAVAAQDALVNAVKTYPATDTGIFCIDALTNTGFASPEWAAFLTQYLDKATASSARVSALRALVINVSHIKTNQLTQRLEPLLEKEADPLVVEAALYCMAEINVRADAVWLALERLACGGGAIQQKIVLEFLRANAARTDAARAEAVLKVLRNSPHELIRQQARKLAENG